MYTFFKKIKSGAGAIKRVVFMQDTRAWTKGFMNNTRLFFLTTLINLLDGWSKVASPLALSVAIDIVAKEKEKEQFPFFPLIEAQFTGKQLLYLAAGYGAFHMLVPDIKKLITVSPQAEIPKILAKQIFARSQELALTENKALHNKPFEDIDKNFFYANFEMPALISNTLDNIHPLLFDIIIGISITTARFGFDIGGILTLYFVLSLALNELLTRQTDLPKLKQEIQQAYSDRNQTIYEILNHSETVYLFHREKLERRNIGRLIDKVTDLQIKASFYERAWVLQPLLCILIQFLATYYVIDTDGGFEIDDIVFVLCYVATISSNISLSSTSFRSALTSIEHLDEINKFLNLNNMPPSAFMFADDKSEDPENHLVFDKYIVDEKTAIEFENVSFHYDPEEPILDNLSFRVAAGSKVALVGTTNFGKTTITKLLLGLIKPVNSTAKIKLFGRDINEIPSEVLRKIISYSTQRTELFSQNSIRYNLLYAFAANNQLFTLKKEEDEARTRKLDIKDDTVELETKAESEYVSIREEKDDDELSNQILKNSAALALLPEKFLERPQCRGISGGEAQRIGLARVFSRRNFSQIFILDEPTSQIDSVTENAVFNNFKNHVSGTFFVIAHRLSTIKDFDKILVLDKNNERRGRSIVEEGQHKNLVEKEDGKYQSLWRLQT